MKAKAFLVGACVLALGFGMVPAQASSYCVQGQPGATATCSLPLGGTRIYIYGYSYWNTPDVNTVAVTVSLGGVEIGRCTGKGAYGTSCGDFVINVPAGAMLPQAAMLDCTATGPSIAIQTYVQCYTSS